MSKWVPASAGKAKAGMVHSVRGCTRGEQVKLWDPLRTHATHERLVCSWQGAIQIHIYLYFTLPNLKPWPQLQYYCNTRSSYEPRASARPNCIVLVITALDIMIWLTSTEHVCANNNHWNKPVEHWAGVVRSHTPPGEIITAETLRPWHIYERNQSFSSRFKSKLKTYLFQLAFNIQ